MLYMYVDFSICREKWGKEFHFNFGVCFESSIDNNGDRNHFVLVISGNDSSYIHRVIIIEL